VSEKQNGKRWLKKDLVNHQQYHKEEKGMIREDMTKFIGSKEGKVTLELSKHIKFSTHIVMMVYSKQSIQFFL
jgi:hypothetical protein